MELSQHALIVIESSTSSVEILDQGHIYDCSSMPETVNGNEESKAISEHKSKNSEIDVPTSGQDELVQVDLL